MQYLANCYTTMHEYLVKTTLQILSFSAKKFIYQKFFSKLYESNTEFINGHKSSKLVLN